MRDAGGLGLIVYPTLTLGDSYREGFTDRHTEGDVLSIC